MRTVVGEDVVIEGGLSMEMAKELENIFFAFQGADKDYQERSQKSRSQVLGIRMPLILAWCTPGIELAGLTRRSRSNSENTSSKLYEIALTLSRPRSATPHIFATVDSEYKDASMSLTAGFNSSVSEIGGVTCPKSSLFRGGAFGSRTMFYFNVSTKPFPNRWKTNRCNCAVFETRDHGTFIAGRG
jgi:hypothetical protein